MTAQGNKSKEVDEYISSQLPEARRALESLRRYIHEAAPGVSELINYQIPAFALVKGGKRDQQVMIAGFARHVGFYPSPSVIEAFADRLVPYKFAKGSVQFPLDKPMPRKLVIDMVRFRLRQLSP